MSPLSLNPALTGDYTGDWRFMNNFRRQWAVLGYPYQTVSLAFDKQFYLVKDKVSAGLIYINDNSGPAALNAHKIALSGGYHKSMGKQAYHAGLQLGYVSKSFNISKLTFPSQYDGETGGFNNQLSNGQGQMGEKISYLDVNLGFGWNMDLNAMFKPFAGIAVFHANFPRESFRNGTNRLKPRTALTAGSRINFGKTFYVVPSFLTMGHRKATDFLPGTLAGINLPQNMINAKSIYLLVFFRDGLSRNTDAFIAGAGMNFKRLQVGLSYDINISDLKATTSNRGAIEFALIYTGLSSLPQKIVIPCDRY